MPRNGKHLEITKCSLFHTAILLSSDAVKSKQKTNIHSMDSDLAGCQGWICLPCIVLHIPVCQDGPQSRMKELEQAIEVQSRRCCTPLTDADRPRAVASVASVDGIAPSMDSLGNTSPDIPIYGRPRPLTDKLITTTQIQAYKHTYYQNRRLRFRLRFSIPKYDTFKLPKLEELGVRYGLK